MQVRYDPVEDRLLLQIRTRSGELFSIWLTRRMVARLWGPFLELVSTLQVARAAPNATVSPEAREMLSQAARERPLPRTDFETPFQSRPVAEPLGPTPLLPEAVNLSRAQAGGLMLRLREPQGRHLEMRLGDDLATGLFRLLEKALALSDWGLAVPKADPTPTPGEEATPPRVLN